MDITMFCELLCSNVLGVFVCVCVCMYAFMYALMYASAWLLCATGMFCVLLRSRVLHLRHVFMYVYVNDLCGDHDLPRMFMYECRCVCVCIYIYIYK